MDRLVALSSPPVVANCSANMVDEDPVMMDQSCITLFVHLPCAGWFRSFPACCAVCYSYLGAQSSLDPNRGDMPSRGSGEASNPGSSCIPAICRAA